MPRFSIIVPVYNVECYLPMCIDSIRNQTFTDFEVLCVIDGSTDRSEAILKLFERVEPRIRLIRKENGGLSSARNAGIREAKGDFLVFLDSDDMLNRKALETLDRELAGYDANVITFGAEIYPPSYNDGWLEEVLSPERARYDVFEPKLLFEDSSHPFAWRTAVSRRFMEESGLLFDESIRYGEDQVFHFALYPRAERTLIIPDKLYVYRAVRRDSLMDSRQKNTGLLFKDHLKIADRILEDWRDEGFLARYKADMETFVAEFLMVDAVYLDEGDNEESQVFRLFMENWFGPITPGLDLDDISSEMYRLVRDERFDASSAEYAELRRIYLGGRIFDVEEAEQDRSEVNRILRRVLPMSALALQERLGVVKDHIDTELSVLYADDAAACARSLELLRCELMSLQLEV